MARKSPSQIARRRPELTVASCTCANIRKAARVVTQMYDAALRPVGLKATQFSLLAVLAKRGDLPVTGLAAAMVMDRTTLTRNLKPLVARGWVGIESEKDQRVRRVRLTASGSAVFQDALPRWEEVQSRLVSGLGVERWTAFLDDLGATVAAAKGA